MVNSLSWILPFTIIMGSLVDAILVYIYMKYVHQWKDILSSEEVSNPKSESHMEEFHEPTIETPTQHPNDSSDGYPIQMSTEQHNASRINKILLMSTEIFQTGASMVPKNIEIAAVVEAHC